ncbi:MAG: hypothetical protein WAK29_12985 [Terriglobales bacterium]
MNVLFKAVCKLSAQTCTIAVTALAIIATYTLAAAAAEAPAYEGSVTDLVQQYKSNLDTFDAQYNKKVVHLTNATVTSVTLPDAKTGAPWLISLKDDSASGSPANVSCFVSASLSSSDHQRALAVKKSAHINVVATVQADGFALGLTNCRVVEPGLVLGAAAASSKQTSGPPESAQQPAGPFSFTVTKTWNDEVNGVLYVHAAMFINGGSRDVNLERDDFVLSMRLANGARKSYPSMSQAAPTYERVNLLVGFGGSTVGYQVAPKEDLGAIGPMTIPAHGNVSIVVTFQVPDPVADPLDTHAISLR